MLGFKPSANDDAVNVDFLGRKKDSCIHEKALQVKAMDTSLASSFNVFFFVLLGSTIKLSLSNKPNPLRAITKPAEVCLFRLYILCSCYVPPFILFFPATSGTWPHWRTQISY
jgi:NhaP-type Na+/H+ or K+/H+ antiporter